MPLLEKNEARTDDTLARDTRETDSHAGDKFSVSQVRHEAGLFLDGLTRMTEWCGRRGAIRRIRARVVGATDGAMSMWTMDA